MGGHMETELFCALLEEHFGPTVASVAAVVIREPGPLSNIVSRLRGEFPVLLIRKSLVVLEQFGIVHFKMDGSMRVQYFIVPSAIHALSRAPRCGLIVKTLLGEQAETVFLEILYHGRITCSQVLRKVASKSESGTTLSQIKEKFCRLSELQFVARCAPLESTLKGCPQFAASFDPFIMPDLILQDTKDNMATENGTRKRKSVAADADADIYWRVNWTRFDRYIRDEMVMEIVVPNTMAVGERAARVCKDTMSAFLKSNETRSSSISASSSAPVSISDMLRCVREHAMDVQKSDIEWALRFFVEEGRGVIRKAGDSGGGLFLIDFDRAIQILTENHLESLIREQLDTKAVRIFRLLKARGNLEEDQIEKLTMMSAKETRELLYALQEEGYVFTRPVGRTNDFAPARTIYLYYVNLAQAVLGVLEYNCKILRNLVLRRKSEAAEHKQLIDKELTMQSIADNIREDSSKDEATKAQEIAEVKETYMPLPEQNKFDQFMKSRSKLKVAECEIERTLFTLRLFMDFSVRKC